MKYINFFRLLFFVVYFLGGNSSLLAQSGPDLAAIMYNGKLTVQVKNSTVLGQYFYIDATHQVSLDFYFAQDDARNGMHYAFPVSQTNGQVYLVFTDLPWDGLNVLSFIATETLATGTIKDYVFVSGGYVPTAGLSIGDCPVSISCSDQGVSIHFSNSLNHSNRKQVTLFNKTSGFSLISSTPAIDLPLHSEALYLREPGINANNVLNGTLILIYDGHTCGFENGIAMSDYYCTPWSDYEANGTCAPYFENCALEIIELLYDARYTLPCKQWVDQNACTTTALITRTGRVAIGTSHYAREDYHDAMLTVKNGIVTDRVKVVNCALGGWCDYVFEKDYPLMPLEELEAYIVKYGHLPKTASAKEIEATGSLDVGEITFKQQEKIEEIFLHLISLEQETTVLEAALLVQKTKVKAGICSK